MGWGGCLDLPTMPRDASPERHSKVAKWRIEKTRQNRENREIIIKMNGFLNFLRGLSWGLLNRLKMLPQDVGTFSTIGQPILRTFIFWSFLTLPPSLVAKWRMGYP